MEVQTGNACKRECRFSHRTNTGVRLLGIKSMGSVFRGLQRTDARHARALYAFSFRWLAIVSGSRVLA